MSDLLQALRRRSQAHAPGDGALVVEDLWVAYEGGRAGRAEAGRPDDPGAYALEAISFRAAAGDQVAVVGPNGAGKSTLLKVIAGALKPSRGAAWVHGHEPGRHSCTAYVPQRNHVDWTFPVSVADVVMMGRVGRIGLLRWPGRRDWAAVREALERVGLATLARVPIGELSGGQQQRAFIGRALAQGADILLLDEPFSSLDAPSLKASLAILEGLRLDGVTVLLSTHDLNLAAGRFDSVLLLNRRLVAAGPAPAVLTAGHLVEAYRGHSHVLADGDGMIVADSCCDDG
jgi:ABC-type Mn2+/Zn2+ transport system ATPase subunit